MKKFYIICLAVLTLSSVISIPKEVRSADFSAGVYGYYVWWKPAWRTVYEDFDNDPMLLWGPYLSVTFFQKLSLSALFIQNIFNLSDASYSVHGSGSLGEFNGKVDTIISRNDLDLTASYKVSGNASFFTGFKYSGYDEGGIGGESDAQLTVEAPYTTNSDALHRTSARSNSLAAGGSYTFSPADSVYITAGTSFLFGQLTMSFPDYYEKSPGIIASHEGDEIPSYKYKTYGNNTTLNVSYYIPAISTSLSLGGRFQVLKYISGDDAPDLDRDYFYGITASAVCFF